MQYCRYNSFLAALHLQVPMMRQAILDSVPDWPAFAQRQRDAIFAPNASSNAAQRRRDKMMAAIDFMCSSLDTGSADDAQQQVCCAL